MGNQKQKWTAEEEEALLAGVAKHGPGKWKNILKDPHFAPFLTHRSNIGLKDKWRNLSVSTSGQGSKEKLRTSKVKTVTAAPLPNVQNYSHAAPLRRKASIGTVVDDPSSSMQEGKNARRRGGWCSLIGPGQRMKPGVFFKLAISTLGGKSTTSRDLEKETNKQTLAKMEVQNSFKIRKQTVLGTKTPSPQEKDVKPWQSISSRLMITSETVDSIYLLNHSQCTSYLDDDDALKFTRLLGFIIPGSRGEIVLLA
ncbi:uncharacterized protein LOC109011745 isoform X1 [Juglans regia]|uniref:MYB transcription factor n=1 Tax=Juglans regia TaxID=51240 RepID=A0A6P9EAE3_JUGRE|nr:uncharacterized protein LOC109011745 isoform X1 [Juglans regia]